MAAFYKITSNDYEVLQVILMYVLFTIGNTAARLDTISLHKWYAHTHTHNFPLEILIWLLETLNIFEHIRFNTWILSAFSTRDWEMLWRTSVGTVGIAVTIQNNHGPNTSQKHHLVSSLFDRNSAAFIFLSFFLSLFSSTNSFRIRGGLFHLVALNETHTHTLSLSLSLSLSISVRLLWAKDQSVAETSPWQHTALTRDSHPCHRRNSNPQSQLSNDRRPIAL